MLQRSVAMLVVFVCLSSIVKAQDPLDQYVQRLRQSQASGGSETGFLSVGSTFLYGQDYFDKKEYDLANMYFMQAYQKDSSNAFVNYQIAASLLKQKDQYKTQAAQKYLQNAFRLNPGLKSRYAREFGGDVAADKPTAADQPQQNSEPAAPKGLSKYVEELKYSRSTGGALTQMNSSGLDVMYGYDYAQKGEMDLAAIRFRQAVAKAPDDIYANYMLGVSLRAQGLDQEAAPYLKKAIAGDPALQQRVDNEVARATESYQKVKDSKKITTTPTIKPTYGGKLVFGNYNCTETVWNGPNANPPYSYPRKGYFELKPDGTYRWLDNGITGRYTYDEKTGNIKWLSGYLANMKAGISQYKPGVNVSQITVNLSADYRWECGCDKK